MVGNSARNHHFHINLQEPTHTRPEVLLLFQLARSGSLVRVHRTNFQVLVLHLLLQTLYRVIHMVWVDLHPDLLIYLRGTHRHWARPTSLDQCHP